MKRPEAGAAGPAVPPELGEDARPDLLGDPVALVVDDDLGAARRGIGRDRDLDVSTTVLDGVLDQVGEDLSEPVAVDPDLVGSAPRA